MAINLESVTGGKSAILSALQVHPHWTATRFKTTKLASDLALQIAKDRSTTYFHAVVMTPLQEAFTRYVTVNGERPPQEELASDWASGLDDELYAVFEPHAHLVSSTWLVTISDVTPSTIEEVEKMAASFAAEVWREQTWQKTDNQKLSAVGIVLDDLQAIMLSHAQTQENPDMNVNAILNKIILNFIPEEELEGHLDNASETERPLRETGALALGITNEEADYLAVIRAQGGSVIEGWCAVINRGVLQPVEEAAAPAPVPPPPVPDPLAIPAILVREPPPVSTASPVPPPPPVSSVATASGTVPPPPPQAATGQAGSTVPPPPPPVNPGAVTTTGTPPSKRGRKAATQGGPPEGTVPAEALIAIKGASGLKDDDFATRLGVSRPTFNNYLRGKGYCQPSPDQRKNLLAMVDAKIGELEAAKLYLLP